MTGILILLQVKISHWPIIFTSPDFLEALTRIPKTAMTSHNIFSFLQGSLWWVLWLSWQRGRKSGPLFILQNGRLPQFFRLISILHSLYNLSSKRCPSFSTKFWHLVESFYVHSSTPVDTYSNEEDWISEQNRYWKIFINIQIHAKGGVFLQTKAHLDILAEALLRWARGR